MDGSPISQSSQWSIRVDWKHVGSTSQTDFYWTPSNILVAVPFEGAIDDEASSLENRTFQQTWADEHGPFGLAIIVDRLASQNRDARSNYAEIGTETLTGVALVGGTLLSRAISSFFLGLMRPKATYQMFADLDSALAWLEERA